LRQQRRSETSWAGQDRVLFGWCHSGATVSHESTGYNRIQPEPIWL